MTIRETDINEFIKFIQSNRQFVITYEIKQATRLVIVATTKGETKEVSVKDLINMPANRKHEIDTVNRSLIKSVINTSKNKEAIKRTLRTPDTTEKQVEHVLLNYFRLDDNIEKEVIEYVVTTQCCIIHGVATVTNVECLARCCQKTDKVKNMFQQIIFERY